MTIETLDLSFAGFYGDKLSAKLDRPTDKEPKAYALFSHCFTGSKDFIASERISQELAEHGVATLRFDFPGLGDSEGDFGDQSFSSNVNDIISASNFLRKKFEAPKILIGHSLGGAAMLVASHQIPEGVVVATIGTPFEPKHVRHLFEQYIGEIHKSGEAMVEMKGRRFRINENFLSDLEAQNPDVVIGDLHKALLVFHSHDDAMVNIYNAHHIFDKAHHPKSFIELDHADHLVKDPADAAYIASVLVAWADRYLPVNE